MLKRYTLISHLALSLCMFGQGCSNEITKSNGKMSTVPNDVSQLTGVLHSISLNTVSLEYPYGGLATVGYSCWPEVCPNLELFEIGAKVLLTVGVYENRRILLRIEHCISREAECINIAEEGLRNRIAEKKRNEHILNVQKDCIAKVDSILAKNEEITTVKAAWMRRSGEYDRELGKRYPQLTEKLKSCKYE